MWAVLFFAAPTLRMLTRLSGNFTHKTYSLGRVIRDGRWRRRILRFKCDTLRRVIYNKKPRARHAAPYEFLLLNTTQTEQTLQERKGAACQIVRMQKIWLSAPSFWERDVKCGCGRRFPILLFTLGSVLRNCCSCYFSPDTPFYNTILPPRSTEILKSNFQFVICL